MNPNRFVNQETFIKKTILCSVGTILVGLGVAIFLKSRLGSDPISVWIDGLHVLLGMPIGKATSLNHIITLILAISLARRYIYFGTVIAALGTGPVIGFFEPYIDIIFTGSSSFAMRLTMIMIGQLILCIGIAITLSANFGFGATDSIIITICDKTNLKYRYLKMTFDAAYTFGGILLGGVFGVGTILGVLTGGPLISVMKKGVDQILLKWFKFNVI